MRVALPTVDILDPINGDRLLMNIERAGRTCYKSEQEFSPETARKFVAMILQRGHESVIEHEKLTVRFVVDRGVSHEIVRHRLASYSQESTRYCNYSKDKFDNQITVIEPHGLSGEDYETWKHAVFFAEQQYMALVDNGVKPEWARSVLPNSLKTEVVTTYNLREWRHFFKLRTAAAAHPQMRQVSVPLLRVFSHFIPVLFEDIINACTFGQEEGSIPWAKVRANGMTFLLGPFHGGLSCADLDSTDDQPAHT